MLCVRVASADETAVFVETDPATFVLGGFAAPVRIRPSATPQWSFGMGAYALNLPSVMVALDSANRDLGWSSRIVFAGSAFIDRYFRRDGEGAFVGAQLGVQQFRVTRASVDGQREFTTVLAMPRIGYLWRPFGSGFYVMPWLGLGLTAKVAGGVMLGGATYDVFPVVAFATVHAGWRF
jgi:hypothetical protein